MYLLIRMPGITGTRTPLLFSGTSDGTIHAWQCATYDTHSARGGRATLGAGDGSKHEEGLEDSALLGKFTAHTWAVTGLHVDGNTLYRCFCVFDSECVQLGGWVWLDR